MISLRKSQLPISDAPSANPSSQSQIVDQSSSYSINYIFVRSNRGYERISFSDILYIRAGGAYSDIITLDHSYILSTSLKNVLEQLECDFIKRCHRSYAVNIHKITFFNDVSLELTTTSKDIHLPITVGYRSSIMDKLKRLRSR
jgi:DNA-binding LytR/AlgR family response regulator